jgi:UDP-glucose 4-epimerase
VHVLSLEALREGSHSKIYNLGNGQGFSVREVIGQACKITGHKIPLKIGPRRAGDAPSLVADAMQIKKDLNWIPRYQELEQIIDTAWQWHLYGCRTKNS